MRLHLQHGPIDLIIGADGPGRKLAFAAAIDRFATVLDGLVADLPRHRTQLRLGAPLPSDPVARQMYLAAMPHAQRQFLTPMIAVAGAVADTILAAILAATPLTRAYVNNGGDIAVHLAQGATFDVAIATPTGGDLGRLHIAHDSGICGIATSGTGGRSFTLGIADSVTVVARTAAQADVAATLIANAVDLPDYPGIRRVAAHLLQPDSDLQDRKVVTHVPTLSHDARLTALGKGLHRAKQMQNVGHIIGAALFLQGETCVTGAPFETFNKRRKIEHA